MTDTEHIDLAKTVGERPWPAVGVAFAAGALLAIMQPRPPRTAVGRSLLAAIGGVALTLVREVAMQRALVAARGWLDAEHAS